ncbi:MAG: UbiA family prenyltransferase [Legionella sp.]|uniref:UbiA family prenyltransferase n=1 Tax=Legionella sp. TaxID=459 RepID=UPI0039E4F2CA
MNLQPLVVDLDGTLIHTDMLHESVLDLLRKTPWDALRIPFWLAKGKAVLKQLLAKRTQFNPQSLPYNMELMEWLKTQKNAGRTLILCTATDHSIASSIADHLGLFDEVIATDGSKNLAGKNKADALQERFGDSGFDYIGNSNTDLAVWKHARRAIVVNAHEQLVKKASACCEVERVFHSKVSTMSTWARVLRVHQWLKNSLLFVPMFSAHELTQADNWLSLIFAFFSFSFCASSVYIANDLLDLESDRLHPRKRKRPFASGEVPISMGIRIVPVLLLMSYIFGSFVKGDFLLLLASYFTLTVTYSFGLKRIVLVDCLTLALLYTLRIIAGAVATTLSLTFWLLAFSVFLFLSLAFVKRYAELETQQSNEAQKIHGRGYYTSDAPLIQAFGIASGYAAVLVLAFYLNSESVLKLYRTPEFVWGAVPIMLFWINWIWVKAHRGLMHDDPLVFAVKDRGSLIAGALFASVLALGTIGISW